MRVVLVSHHFEPGTSAGAARATSLARGLHARGHDVLVITAQRGDRAEQFRVVAVPYASIGSRAKRSAGIASEANAAQLAATRGPLAEKAVRFAARTAERALMYPDPQHMWIRAVRRWLENGGTSEVGRADVVIASALPLSALIAGTYVARASSAPLITEFRDLWTRNPRYPFGRLRRLTDARYERAALSAASAVVVVTEGLRKALNGVLSDKRTVVIPNGVDPFPARPAQSATTPGGVFRLGYCGITYAGDHDLRPAVRAVRRLADAGVLAADRVRLEVFGDEDAGLGLEASRLGLEDLLEHRGFVPREQLYERLSDVHVALCPLSERDRDTLPVKVMDYLAAGRTVLASGAAKTWELRVRLQGTPGVHFVESDKQLEAAIGDLWNAWTAGDSLFWPVDSRPSPFTATAMVDDYEVLLDEVARSARAKIATE